MRRVVPISLSLALMASCAGASEGPTESVDPRAFVRHVTPEALRARDERATEQRDTFRAATERLAEDPCGVAAQTLDLSDVAPSIARSAQQLARFAEVLCDARIDGVGARHGEDGTLQLDVGDAGARRVGETIVVAGNVDGFTFEQLPADGVLEGACIEPDARGQALVVGDDQPYLITTAHAEARVRIIVSDPNGELFCAGGEDGEVAAILDSGAGRYNAWLVADSPEVASELEVSSIAARGGGRGVIAWGVGDPIRRRVNVRGRLAADEIAGQCAGYIAEEPTIVLYAIRSISGEVRVTSDGDPVLVALGPDGEVRCNDDYDGLNPALLGTFAQGRWEVHVGSYSQNDQFQAELVIY